MSKSHLNLYCQKSHIPTPGYVTKTEGGLFTSTVTVNGESYSSVEGHTTKKEAEQDAAGVALQSLVQRHTTATSPEELIKSVDAEMSSKHKKTLASQNPAKISSVAQRLASTRATSKQQTLHSAEVPHVVPQQGLRASQQGPRVPQQQPRVPQQGLRESQQGLGQSQQGLGQSQGLREALTTVSAHMLLSRPPPELPGVGVATMGAGAGQIGGRGGFGNPHYLPPSLHHSTSFPLGSFDSSVNPRCSPGPPRGLLGQVPSIHYPAVSTVPPGFALQQQPGAPPPMPTQSHLSYATPHYLPVHPILSGEMVAYSGGGMLMQEPQQAAAEMPDSSSPLTEAEGHHAEMPLPAATFEPQPSSIPGDRRSPLLGGSPTPPAPAPPQPNAPLNFELELQQYCLARSLPPPAYCTTMVKGQRRRVTVKVGDAEFGGERDYESAELARENATLVALASIGLAALKRELEAHHHLSCRQWQSGREELSPKPRSLSSPAESEASSATVSSVSSSQAVESLRFQQLSVSGSPASTSAVSAAAFVPPKTTIHPLQPPSFFSSSSSQSKQVSSSSSTQQGGTAGQLTAPVQTRSEQASSSQKTTKATMQANKTSNHKVTLNTYCERRGIPAPQYDCSYPEDAVGYIVTVTVAGKKFTSTSQGTKRGAESKAAGLALQSFGEKVEMGEEEGINGRSFQGEWVDPSAIAAKERSISYKNILQEHIHKSQISQLPRYETERTEDGFVCSVVVRLSTDKTRRFQGLPHANKKAAEQESAKVACHELKLVT